MYNIWKYIRIPCDVEVVNICIDETEKFSSKPPSFASLLPFPKQAHRLFPLSLLSILIIILTFKVSSSVCFPPADVLCYVTQSSFSVFLWH